MLRATQVLGTLCSVNDTSGGMGHCGGGLGTTQFDLFASLVNWVENKTMNPTLPDTILGTEPAGRP